MIRFLQHSEIDPEKWNQAVRNSLSPNVLSEYELLDLYTPFFLPQMGIFYRQDIRPSVYEGFLEEISKHYVLADLLMNGQNALDCEELQFPPHFVSYTLSMHFPYNELYSQFHENTRRNIKAAQKQQSRVTVQEEKIADIIALFRTNKGSEEAVC